MSLLPVGPIFGRTRGSNPRRLTAAVALAAGLGLVPLGCRREHAAPPAPPPSPVTVVRPVVYPVQNYHEYNGYLDSIDAVQIKARVKGFLEKVHFVEGDEVKPGDLLYTIDPREYEAAEAKAKADIKKAEADIENAKAQVTLAEAELKRLRMVGTAAAATELDKAVATLAANKAQRDVATANRDAGEAALRTARLDLEYTRIKAPIGGRINRTLVTQGNLVGQNETTLLTTIVRMDTLYIYYDAPERDLIEYQKSLRDNPGSAAVNPAVPVDIGVATEEGFPHAGVIDFRENRVDPGTGTIHIRGRIPNPIVPPGNARLLYPGLFTRVRVPVGGLRQLPVVPEDALMTGQEGRFLYVIGKENKVHKRAVVVGAQVWKAPPPGEPAPPGWTVTNRKPPAAGGGGRPAGPVTEPVRSVVAIEKGLTTDDTVIVAGLQRARPGGEVAPEEWELRAPPAAPPVAAPAAPR